MSMKTPYSKTMDKNNPLASHPDPYWERNDFLSLNGLWDFEITKELIKKKGKGNPVAFYAKTFWINRKKITFKKIIFNIKGALNKN